MSSPRAKAISREVADLCRKLRPIAVDLVDAFGVPEEMLRSPDLVGRGRHEFPGRPVNSCPVRQCIP